MSTSNSKNKDTQKVEQDDLATQHASLKQAMEDLKAELEKWKKENSQLQAQVDELTAQNETLELAVVKAQKTGIVSLPVKGIFEVSMEPTNGRGKAQKKRFRFKDGHNKVYLASGQKVYSTSLIKLANGQKLEEEELLNSPALNQVDQKTAQQRLEYFVSIGANTIEEVD